MSNLPFRPYTSVSPPTILWHGQSGVRYPFELWPIGTVFRDHPGVYIFCKPAANGNWDAVYIGETKSFQSRLTDGLAQHHQWVSIVHCGASHLCVMHVPGGLTLRERIETDLRRHIKTPCNLQ
ncbi:hypothetical protein NVS89_03735 [Ancylobacter sp. MQZ15Z-1]|uniref:GIY-YIG domain-containing protein n=1 Tax=Ancylobacter mangrovi TaxID=2972472 RepID=A0A9X2T2U7_9HYPH|nr:hypothetical protein [Ancylobacter mangrovi]MCS0494196.1 hypothetical protein [Ancylobacter mangrovi]